MYLRTLLLATAVLMPVAAHAAGSTTLAPYALTSTSYTQTFDTLGTTGTSSSLPAGFQVVELGTGGAADGLYAAGTGSSNAGNAYSFGAAGSAERALGSLASGTVSPIYLGGIFSNGLAGTISSLSFAFTGEQWRAGNSNDDGLRFEYSLDATALGNGSWTAFAALDFLPLIFSGNAALNGNAATNSAAIGATLSNLAIGSGDSFGFRWVDTNSSSNDHGLAIDNLSINATLAAAPAVPEPATWAMLIGGFALAGASLRTTRRQAIRFA